MCNTLVCINHFLVIHLTLIFVLFTLTKSTYFNDSIGNYSFRSSPSSSKYASTNTIYDETWATTNLRLNTPLAQPPTSNQSVPELIDQCEASISSSESDTSSLLSSEDESEISKFQNICLYTSSLLLS